MIAAAGSGERLGAGGPKAFVELAGRPLIEHSLAAVAAARTVSTLVVAVPAELVDPTRQRLGGRDGPPVTVLAGGASRAESVREALAAVATDLVAIHDAARPLAPAPLFDAVVERLAAAPGASAAIAATPVRDTVKRSAERNDAGGGEVAETMAREYLWAAQTPQAFRTAALRTAQQTAAATGRLSGATDEASLIEAAGGTVLLEPSTAHNLKVTTAEDLRIAAALLGGSGGV